MVEHGEAHFDRAMEAAIEPVIEELTEPFERRGLKGQKFDIAVNAMMAMLGNTIGQNARSVDELVQNLNGAAEAIASRAQNAFMAKVVTNQ